MVHEFFSNLPDGLVRSMKKFTLIYAIAAVIIYTAFSLTGIASEVGTLYYRYADLMINGQMPYSDFAAEYPPFAMLLILIPRLFSWSPFSYQIAFGFMAYLFLLAGLYFIYGIAERYTENPVKCVNWYIIFTIALFDFAVDRYDVFPMVMVLGALYFISKEKYAGAWAMLALGTVTKLYPALLAPILLFYLLSKKKNSESMKGVAICLVIGIGSLLPFFITDVETALSFLTYHMDRGLQIESLPASAIMFLSVFGLTDITYNFSFGSDNIAGVLPDAVAGIMMPLMIVALLATYIVYLRKCMKNSDDGFKGILIASTLVVMIFMIVNKVLSSQYLLWIIPFVALGFIVFSEKIDKRNLILFGGSIALTQLDLIVNYAFRGAGEELSILGILVILIRNILMVIMLWYVVRRFSKGFAPSDEGL